MPAEKSEGDPLLAEFGMPNAGLTIDVGEETAEAEPKEATAEAVVTAPETPEKTEEVTEPEKTTLEELTEGTGEVQEGDRLSNLERENARLQGMMEAMVRQADQKVLAEPEAKKEDELQPYNLEDPAIVNAIAEASEDPKEQALRMLRLTDAQIKRQVEIASRGVKDEVSQVRSAAEMQGAAQAAERRLQKNLDVLQEHGGKTGKELVEQFRTVPLTERPNTYIGQFITKNAEMLLGRNEMALSLGLQGAVDFLNKAVELKRQGAVQPGVETTGVTGTASLRGPELNQPTSASEEELDDEDKLLDGMLGFNQVPKEDALLQALFNPPKD